MQTHKLKKVLYVGNYFEEYCRNYTFFQTFKQNKIKVFKINIKNLVSKKNKILILFKELRKLKKQKLDLLIFYSLETFSLPFIITRFYAFIRRIPFIHDIFISKLQTYYYDRDLSIIKKRIKIKLYYWIYYYLLDFFETNLSDYVLLDSLSHIKYFHNKFRVPLKKFYKIYIGSRDDIFFPLIQDYKKKNEFLVGFWGTFIPLQGIQYILKAAKILESDPQIKFILVGNGLTFFKNKVLAKDLQLTNLEFTGFIPLRDLPSILKNFDIALGIFGHTSKTVQVIPNKVFEANAMKLPVISCESPAINELYNNFKDILLCKPADPKSLSESILKLKNDSNLREKIKEEGYMTYQKNASSKILSKKIMKILNYVAFKKK